MKEKDLKPCPFCGHNYKHDNFYLELHPNPDINLGYIKCLNCGAKGPTVKANWENSQDGEPWHENAIKAWNRREAHNEKDSI